MIFAHRRQEDRRDEATCLNVPYTILVALMVSRKRELRI